MTVKKRTVSGAGKGRKLKLKKETVRDLDPKGKASGVQGGVEARTVVPTKLHCGKGC